jgi:hypothetical protein
MGEGRWLRAVCNITQQGEYEEDQGNSKYTTVTHTHTHTHKKHKTEYEGETG